MISAAFSREIFSFSAQNYSRFYLILKRKSAVFYGHIPRILNLYSVILKQLPPSGLSRICMLPLCFFITLSAIASPSPDPPISRERDLSTPKNGSKICFFISRGIPIPVSEISTSACASHSVILLKTFKFNLQAGFYHKRC